MASGAEQLKDWMHRRRFMQQEAAEYFGWHFTYVSQLITGARLPGLDNAIKLERMTGIPVEAWRSSSVDTAEAGAAVTAKSPRNTEA